MCGNNNHHHYPTCYGYYYLQCGPCANHLRNDRHFSRKYSNSRSRNLDFGKWCRYYYHAFIAYIGDNRIRSRCQCISMDNSQCALSFFIEYGYYHRSSASNAIECRSGTKCL